MTDTLENRAISVAQGNLRICDLWINHYVFEDLRFADLQKKLRAHLWNCKMYFCQNLL
jgi:hypothetical protein